jgi:hypothetical protein
MMRYLYVAAVISIAFVIAGCDSKGVPIAFDQACTLGNDKKTIETSGFLDDNGSVFCSNTSGRMECGFAFKKSPDGKKGFSADIAIGSGANSMDRLERGYKKEDIVIRNNEGNTVDLGKEVKITGDLSAYQSDTEPNGVGCFVKVYKVEQK